MRVRNRSPASFDEQVDFSRLELDAGGDQSNSHTEREGTSSPGREGSELPATPESDSNTRPDDPAITVDLKSDTRASRYARQSTKLPKIGDEAGNTPANMRRLRASSKGQDD